MPTLSPFVVDPSNGTTKSPTTIAVIPKNSTEALLGDDSGVATGAPASGGQSRMRLATILGIKMADEVMTTKKSKDGGTMLVTVDSDLELETPLKASAYMLGAVGTNIVYTAVLADAVLAVRMIGSDDAGVRRLSEFDAQMRDIAKLWHSVLHVSFHRSSSSSQLEPPSSSITLPSVSSCNHQPHHCNPSVVFYPMLSSSLPKHHWSTAVVNHLHLGRRPIVTGTTAVPFHPRAC